MGCNFKTIVHRALVAQLVARRSDKAKVIGSSPVESTELKFCQFLIIVSTFYFLLLLFFFLVAGSSKTMFFIKESLLWTMFCISTWNNSARGAARSSSARSNSGIISIRER